MSGEKREDMFKRRLTGFIVLSFLIPLICGIFFPIYWLLLCPSIWKSAYNYEYQADDAWPQYWFYTYWMIGLFSWMLSLCGMFYFWRKRKSAVYPSMEHLCDEKKRENTHQVVHSRRPRTFRLYGPQYRTKPEFVQPAVPSKKGLTSLLEDGEERYGFGNHGYICDKGDVVPVQSSLIRLQKVPVQGDIQSKGLKKKVKVSFSDDSQKGKEVVRKEYFLPGAAGNVDQDTCIPSDDLNTAHHDGSEVCEGVPVNSSPISERPPLSRENSFKGLPRMKSFDKYLHLVQVDLPESPKTPVVENGSGSCFDLEMDPVYDTCAASDPTNQLEVNVEDELVRHPNGSGYLEGNQNEQILGDERDSTTVTKNIEQEDLNLDNMPNTELLSSNISENKQLEEDTQKPED